MSVNLVTVRQVRRLFADCSPGSPTVCRLFADCLPTVRQVRRPASMRLWAVLLLALLPLVAPDGKSAESGGTTVEPDTNASGTQVESGGSLVEPSGTQVESDRTPLKSGGTPVAPRKNVLKKISEMLDKFETGISYIDGVIGLTTTGTLISYQNRGMS